MNSMTFAAALAFGTLVWAGGNTAPSNHGTAPAKKAPTAAVKKPSTTVARSTAARKPAAKTVPIVRTSWRNRQSSPTTDRYREIQQALAERGYLSLEEANGAWGLSSTDALKRFQAEQTLETTGRIDSLSLIALGLGPKHDSVPPRMAEGNSSTESGRN